MYPKNRSEKLDKELFCNPTAEYRGAPFWAWNDTLDVKELSRQIETFRQMGFGGFHMHVRTGLKTPYLSEEYMAAIKSCIDKAKKEKMLSYLYDEDRWPSGTCGGKVTGEHPEFAQHSLMLTTTPYQPERPHRAKGSAPGRGQVIQRQDNGVLIAVYDVWLDQDGYLEKAEMVFESTSPSEAETEAFDYSSLPPRAGATRWYAYVEHMTDDPWFNDHPYADTLNPEAVKAFLKSTHEVYARHLGDELGNGAKSIFTDEPQFTSREPLAFSDEQKDVFFPWTYGLPAFYEKQYGEALLPDLMELVFELPEGSPQTVRWRFQNAVTKLFIESYCDQISTWCSEHGLYLTGHMMDEPRLESQTKAVGDAMRCIASFGIPGIDMLCDYHEFTTAKQTASAVRQMGREGMTSELYGVTGWDYDFRGHKLQGDWQAALGVTLRVPHLSWLSMRGNAKRDYPASISYQSPWYEKYRIIEDHFARLDTALTRGRPIVELAVVHPVESFWLLWGPGDKTGEKRAQMEKDFLSLSNELLLSHFDYDYLNEALIDEKRMDACTEGGRLRLGKMRYRAVLIPDVLTLRKSTVKLLAAFAEAGGKVLTQGKEPPFIDASLARDSEAYDELKTLYEKAVFVGARPERILRALEHERFVDIRSKNGERRKGLLCQLREDNDCRWLFVCNGQNPETPDIDPAPLLRFTLKGDFSIEKYDTLTGSITKIAADKKQTAKRSGMPKCADESSSERTTSFETVWHIHDSLLLRLSPDTEDGVRPEPPSESATVVPQQADIRFGRVRIEREEPNVMVLDMAEYALDEGAYQSKEELLRIDNMARAALGLPPRIKEVVQPYILMERETEAPKHRIHLRFRIVSETELDGTKLALEEAETASVVLNGEAVPCRCEEDAYFVDRAIRTVGLPTLRKGENILEVTYPLGNSTNLEWLYLLGEFGVKLDGTESTLVPDPQAIGFGNIVNEGLPFYTGNLWYHTEIEAEASCEASVRVPQYRGALTEVWLDGKLVGETAFSPYKVDFTAEKGRHTLSFKLYGTRQNAFGQLHHTLGYYFYQSPNSWFTAGDLWTYEYSLKPAGILKSPELCGARFIQEDGGIRQTLGTAAHHEDLS